jgi:hypothetical protein
MYQNHSDAIDFFSTAVAYYENLRWLSTTNIRPSDTIKYKLGDMQDALKGFGVLPYIGCSV